MRKNQTILVVDDQPDHRYFFNRVLSEAGYTVVENADGRDAVSIVAELCPTLIILDLVMPGPTGWEVAKELKADPRTASIPVFLVTAFPHQASERWTTDVECDALLVKPVEPRRLLAEIERWLTPS